MIELAKAIKYIFNHKSELKDFSKEELDRIDSLLSIAEVKVLEGIITEKISNDIGLIEEIDMAKARVEDKILSLGNEFKENVYNMNFPEGDKNQDGQHDLSERIEEGKKNIKFLNGLKEELSNPNKYVTDKVEKFLDQYFKTYYGETTSERKKQLIKVCAISMTDTGGKIQVSPFNKKPLFEKTDEGYVLDVEAIREFLDLIRNPDLFNELREYSLINAKKSYRENAVNSFNQVIEKFESIYRLLEDDELVSNVESDIKRIAELCSTIKNAQKEEKALLIKKSNTFLDFLKKVFRYKKTDEHGSKDGESNISVDEKVSERHNLYSLIMGKAEKDENYRLLLEFYLSAGGIIDKDNPEESNYRRMESIVSRQNKLGSMKDYIKENGQIKILESENGVEYNGELQNESQFNEILEKYKKELETLNARKKEIINNFSEQAKKILEENPDLHIPEEMKSYVPRTESDLSPKFVTSLILEFLLNMDDIKTKEDAEKMGFVFSDREMNNNSNTITGISRMLIDEIQSGLRRIPDDENLR